MPPDHVAPARLTPWRALADLAPVAALLGVSVADLRVELAGLPDGFEGVALVEEGRIPAAGLHVRAGTVAPGEAHLAWLCADDTAPALRLVEAFEEAARRDGARVLQVVARRVPGLGAVIEARGWTAAPGMIRMSRSDRRAPGPLPAGVEERALSDIGLEALRAVWNASFEGTPFSAPLTREGLERQAAEPAFAPELVRVLVDGEGAVAFLHGTLDAAGVGEVHDIGVLPRARGLGLGRWLLRRSAEVLDRAGAKRVVLRVAEANAVAHRLYASDGWFEVSRALAWRREV